ncbi:hypothetical protein [Leisingera methylohalidivorans]|uniref:hypothetical protein n=1 Tax=Leisingera methylohalidivorans TaxID=133924 RepID=UPI000401C926|nr:hypothetical protein [Leisingera methylohalidivorans]
MVVSRPAAGQGVRGSGPIQDAVAIAGCDRVAAGAAIHVVSGIRTGSGSCKVKDPVWYQHKLVRLSNLL